MKPETEAAIFARYPGIFRDRTKPMTETCMCWGLECGEGWASIIDALCSTIDRPTQGCCSTALDGGDGTFEYTFPQVVADQVKEKFGTLRFYYHIEPDDAFQARAEKFPKTAAKLMDEFYGYVDGAIAMAERLSARTCETTGTPGKLCSRGGWYATVSPEIAKAEGYEEVG